MSRPTLSDSPVKQPLGTRHGQQRADAHRSSRLAEDGDVLWIATKGGDILPYPLEGSDLVEQGAVGVSLVQREEAVDTETVIDGHAHDTVAGEVAAVIPGPRPRSVLKGTARNPDHHRLPRRPEVGGPDIEIQAVLSCDGKLWHRQGYWRLGWLRAIAEGVSHAAPSLNWLWRSEPIGAKGWRCIRNAFKGMHAIGDTATHLAILCFNNCIHWSTSFKGCGSSWSHISVHFLSLRPAPTQPLSRADHSRSQSVL